VSISEAIVKPRKVKFESEDWCIYCRDGGELVLCTHCPRGKPSIGLVDVSNSNQGTAVFHMECRGLTKTDARSLFVSCSQHSCTACHRKTSQAGGMLFRLVHLTSDFRGATF
jgi:SWI/SNF-related matrix-associated actin-dependent regulator of chromatin subfamily A member 5